MLFGTVTTIIIHIIQAIVAAIPSSMTAGTASKVTITMTTVITTMTTPRVPMAVRKTEKQNFLIDHEVTACEKQINNQMNLFSGIPAISAFTHQVSPL
jgi:hypothetical protein